MNGKTIKRLIGKIPGTHFARDLAIKHLLQPCMSAGFRLRGGLHARHAYGDSILSQALEGFCDRSDISDHLGAIFYHAVEASPRLIVELGTRGGESTRALLAAAAVADGTLLSVDLAPQPPLNLPHQERWHFHQGDDIAFGQTGFPVWAADHGLAPEIDVLFIDTSHEYAHTKQEIAVWAPHLAAHGAMIFHDTNMGTVYAHSDGSVGYGWDNARGVIRAIEEFLGRHYDEHTHFVDLQGGFLVKHYPFCSGLTVLRKVGGPAPR